MTQREERSVDKEDRSATARWWLRSAAGAARPLVIAGLILATGSLGILTWPLGGLLLLVSLMRLVESWGDRPRVSGGGR